MSHDHLAFGPGDLRELEIRLVLVKLPICWAPEVPGCRSVGVFLDMQESVLGSKEIVLHARMV